MTIKNELMEIVTAASTMRFGGSTNVEAWPGGGGSPGICSRKATGRLSTIAAVDSLKDISSGVEVSDSRDKKKNSKTSGSARQRSGQEHKLEDKRTRSEFGCCRPTNSPIKTAQGLRNANRLSVLICKALFDGCGSFACLVTSLLGVS